MSKDDADYIDEPVGDEVCANCQFYYVGTDGEAVCSKVRGQVYPEHWCRLWEPGDDLKEKKTIPTERLDKLFNKNRVYVDSPEDVPEQYEVREGNQGGTFYETDSDDTDEGQTLSVEDGDWDVITDEEYVGAEVLLTTDHNNDIQGEITRINEWPGFTSITIDDGDREYTIREEDVATDIQVGDIPDEPDEESFNEDVAPKADLEISEEEEEEISDSNDTSNAQERVSNSEDPNEIRNIVEDEVGVEIYGSMGEYEAKILANGVLEAAQYVDLDNIEDINVGPGSWQTSNEYGYASPEGKIYLDNDALDPDEVRKNYYSGHLATDDVHHIVYHEIGHIIHRQLLDRDRYKELKHSNDKMTRIQKESIRDSLSSYAAQHPNEVVAEGFAKKMAGEELDGLNEMIYEEYGGPDV